MRVYCPSQSVYLELASEPLVPPGGEGQIFLLPERPKSVAKIFTAPGSDHRREKVEALILHPLRDPPAEDGHRRFAMPEEVLLESPDGAFLGYTMARIPNAATLDEFFDPKGSRYFEDALPFRVGLAILVADLVSEVHRHHLMLVLGDMKPRNILADALGRVSYVDLDSLQLTTRSGVTYLCPVRTEFYTAPEVLDKDVRREKREASSDLYALAVIIFQLLFDGWHPYAGQSTTPLAERIRSGALPETLGGRYPPPPTAAPFRALPKEVRRLFLKAFIDGHAEPRARPTGEEWCEALLRHRESLGRFSKEVPPVAVELAAAAAPRTAWTRRRRRSVMTLGAASLLATVAISVACDNLGEEENGEETVAAGVVLPAPPSGDGVPRVSPITSPVLPKHIRARL